MCTNAQMQVYEKCDKGSVGKKGREIERGGGRGRGRGRG